MIYINVICIKLIYFQGFRTLVEREWLSFGHKFADRGGHQPGSIPDMNERCPVFLQWLDVVHQLVRQFPCSFEFSMPYLVNILLQFPKDLLQFSKYFILTFCSYRLN